MDSDRVEIIPNDVGSTRGSMGLVVKVAQVGSRHVVDEFSLVQVGVLAQWRQFLKRRTICFQ